MLLAKTLLLAAAASLASAARLTVSILASPPLLANPATLPSSTHATLVGPAAVHLDAPLRRDNTFVFPDLADASYLLTVYSRNYFFPPLRVDVTKSSDGSEQQTVQVWQTFRGNGWDNKGPSYGTGKGELNVRIQASSGKDFYQPRGGFDLLRLREEPDDTHGTGVGGIHFWYPVSDGQQYA